MSLTNSESETSRLVYSNDAMWLIAGDIPSGKQVPLQLSLSCFSIGRCSNRQTIAIAITLPLRVCCYSYSGPSNVIPILVFSGDSITEQTIVQSKKSTVQCTMYVHSLMINREVYVLISTLQILRSLIINLSLLSLDS